MKVLLLALSAISVFAQQAIVNMPSADITPKGQHFLMHETQMRSWNPGRFWSGTNFYCYGVGIATEACLTSYDGGSPLSPNFSTGFGFKSSPYLSKSPRDYRITFGSMGIVNHRGQGWGNFSYAHFNFKLPVTNTRLTGGGWAGTPQLFGKNTANVLAGIEQPIGKRFILLSEWFAGNHNFGYYIPGILFHPAKDQFIVFAYKIPNPGNNDGKHGFVLEYGLVFGKRKGEPGRDSH